MIIKLNSNANLEISIIKKNVSKISIQLRDKNRNVVKDELFPFNNPLITSDSVKIFEFIIESENLGRRFNKS